MRAYLKKFMTTHKYFVEAVAGFLVYKKGQHVQHYMDYIVQPQVPIDQITIVLFSSDVENSCVYIFRGKILDH